VVNGGGSSSTLGNAGASLNGVYGYLNNQDLTITAATGVNTILEFESDGTGDLNVTEWRGFQSFADQYGSSGSLNVTDFYHYYCDTPSGNITNQYAFYDATNSLSVFGDIQTQAVSITDNLITTNRSNDDLTFGTNGTGRIKLSTDGSDFFNIPLYEAYFDTPDHIKTLGISSDETVNAQTAARNYMVGASQNTTLSASGTSNSNFRQRTMNLANSMDMAGFSFTQASDGRGPIAGNFATNVVNSDTTASTLYTASGLNVAIGAYDEGSFSEGDVTVTDAFGAQSFIELSSSGTGSGNFTFTNAYNYKTKASVGTNDTITNLYGYYYRAPGGSGTITNQYAFYDASNSLSVFGDIQTQAVSITDNTISTNRSNDDLNIKTSGTGRVNISQDGSNLSESSQFSTYWGSDTNIRDFSVYKSTTDDADTVQRNYLAAFTNESTLTNSSSTNSDYRPRTVLASSMVDMAGFSYTRASLTRGPLAFGAVANVTNSSATASTIDTVRGLENAAGGYAGTAGLIAGDVTIKRAIASYNSIYASNDGTGGAGNYTVDDGYGIYVNSSTGGGSDVISNMYGYYYAGGGTISTEYAFYDNANALSRFGAVILANQASDPSGVTDSSHIYAKDDAGSSEVYVRDEAGNVTKISPHNEAGEWEYYSKNSKTGKTVRINMEKLVAEVEKLSGKTFIENE
jgi:hypothetical protein